MALSTTVQEHADLLIQGKARGDSVKVLEVNDVYKAFTKPSGPVWKKWFGRNGKQDNSVDAATGNGSRSNGNGASAGQKNGHGDKKTVGDKKLVVAVNHVSFKVEEGEIFGVLGPNGSGKSTLIRLISTLLLPDSGTIRVFGHDVEKEARKVQELINRVSVDASFFKKLSPMENLLYGARLYGMEGRQTRKNIVSILTRLGLEEHDITNPMEQMSRGMQQKVAIARALLTKPRMLLLDEPTTGLDPRSKREVQDVINELRDDFGVTMLLTTHDMNEADNLCDRIAIMNKGNVVALDTPEKLKTLVPSKNGHAITLEDVFMELTGRELVTEDDLVEMA